MKYSIMFHHFHDDNIYPNQSGGGSISLSDFQLIIDYLDNNFNLLSPDEYTKKVINKDIEELDVCITFDDNLKCQFDIIFPELEKRKLKAFFFVYSKAYSDNPPLLEFFRDFKLNFFKDVDDYYDLFFEVIRNNYVEEYRSLMNSSAKDYLSQYPFYTSNDKKYRFLRDIILKDKYFEIVLGIMREKDYSITNRKDYLFMTIDNIKTLHKSGHSIGLHSHSHPTRIKNLNYKDQLVEYSQNYEFIYAITKTKISSMSHPCGNYNNDTLKVLKELDIKVGFRDSLMPSYIKSPLEIPREDHANLVKMIK